jgi:hypothetical protein
MGKVTEIKRSGFPGTSAVQVVEIFYRVAGSEVVTYDNCMMPGAWYRHSAVVSTLGHLSSELPHPSCQSFFQGTGQICNRPKGPVRWKVSGGMRLLDE